MQAESGAVKKRTPLLLNRVRRTTVVTLSQVSRLFAQ
jgi:hypothetical protein